VGKRKPDPDAVEAAFGQLHEQAGELVDRAVHAWAAVLGMTVEEWAQQWQPRVDVELRPPLGLGGEPPRIVITVRAETRKGAPRGSKEEP
jgi:hypothetical protein